MKIWWVTSDVCGLFCAIFTVALLLYAEIVMANVIMIPWLGLDYNFIIFTSLTILALVAHTRCQLTNPGTVDKIYLPPQLPRDLDFSLVQSRPYNPPKICKTCRTLKTRTTYHCHTCGCCILNMDHHCPWVNNCVGANNQRYFFQFLFYTAVSCLYCAGLLIARFLSCQDSGVCDISSGGILLAILTFIESLIFGAFTIVMTWTQVSAILDEDFAAIQHFKAQQQAYKNCLGTEARFYCDPPIEPQAKTTYELFKDVFGGPFGFSWFNPFTQPDAIKKYQATQLQNCAAHALHVTNRFVEYTRQVNEEWEAEQLRHAREGTVPCPPGQASNATLAPQQQPQQQQQPPADPDNVDLHPTDFESQSAEHSGDDDGSGEDDAEHEMSEAQESLLHQRKVVA